MTLDRFLLLHGKWRAPAAGLAALALSAGAVTGNSHVSAATTAAPARAVTLNIGTKNFDEEYVISDMYKLLLEKHGYSVNIKPLGTTDLLHRALVRGNIDLYPEYTGTGLVAVLHRTAIANPTKAYAAVKKGYAKFRLTWLNQTPMNDTNAIVVSADTASKYHLKNLSSLAKVADKLTFAALSDCKGRQDCEQGLVDKYGIKFNKTTYVTTTDLTIQALKGGQADVAEVFGTDGRIKADKLVQLADNKKAVFPADHLAPVVRNSVLSKNPTIKSILNRLAPYLTTSAVVKLNAGYDIQHQDASALAQKFLQAHHLL